MPNKERDVELLSTEGYFISKEDNKITKADIEKVKNREKIRVIERKGHIISANDWVGFAVSKGLGLAGLVVGGLEWIDPNFLSIVLEKPGIIAGVGLALLTGKNIISLITKAGKALGDE